MYSKVVLGSAHRTQLIRVMQVEVERLLGFRPTWEELMQLLEVRDV